MSNLRLKCLKCLIWLNRCIIFFIKSFVLYLLYLNEVGNHLKNYYKNLSKDAPPTWLFCIGFFIKKINMNKTKQAFYTFAFESSGISYQTDLIPEVGNVFNYWGYKWIVTNVNEDEDEYIVDVEKYKK